MRKNMRAKKDVHECPNCGKKDAFVQDSRMDAKGFLRRKRCCPWCGTVWSTAEIDYETAFDAVMDPDKADVSKTDGEAEI